MEDSFLSPSRLAASEADHRTTASSASNQVSMHQTPDLDSCMLEAENIEAEAKHAIVTVGRRYMALESKAKSHPEFNRVVAKRLKTKTPCVQKNLPMVKTQMKKDATWNAVPSGLAQDAAPLRTHPSLQGQAKITAMVALFRAGLDKRQIVHLLTRALCERLESNTTHHITPLDVTERDMKTALANRGWLDEPLGDCTGIIDTTSGLPRLVAPVAGQLQILLRKQLARYEPQRPPIPMSDNLQPATAVSIACNYNQLGPSTEATLRDLVSQHTPQFTEFGYLLVDVHGLPDAPVAADDLGLSIYTSATSYQQTAMQFSQAPIAQCAGYRSFRGAYRRKLPGESLVSQISSALSSTTPPNLDDKQQWLDTTIKDASSASDRPYFVFQAPTESQIWYDSVLDPGARLHKLPRLEGINTSLRYVSGQDITVAGLHVEDGRLASLNLLITGSPKVWTIIPPSEVSKVVEMGQQLSGRQSKCSQSVRHENMLVLLSTLRQQNIKYEVVVQKPGQLIYTAPDAYHQVVNSGANRAVAINFADSEHDGPGPDYIWCTRRLCNSTHAPRQLQDLARR